LQGCWLVREGQGGRDEGDLRKLVTGHLWPCAAAGPCCPPQPRSGRKEGEPYCNSQSCSKAATNRVGRIVPDPPGVAERGGLRTIRPTVLC
jgi:hypothetical protein